MVSIHFLHELCPACADKLALNMYTPGLVTLFHTVVTTAKS